MSTDLHDLSPVEARILGVLVEKERTTPDAYPLTLNSLTAGCNQKTSREPVLNLTETEVREALEELRDRNLVLETYGASGRVLRYAHNFGKTYALPGPVVPLLAVLMLRGPQTVNELRANCDRLHAFPDASTVEAYLEELAQPSKAMALKLPRQPGAREQRWTHLLCGGDVAIAPVEEKVGTGSLETRVATLETEVAELRQRMENMQILLEKIT